MPILAKETSLFPKNLLAQAEVELADAPSEGSACWWSIYTRSRQEKQLMRKLAALETAFCCPTIERRYRAPNGRVRRVYGPLFSNYVFVYGDRSARHAALTTNCVSQCQQVNDGLGLTRDLARIQRLIDTGEPLSPESRLQPGDLVRIKTGSFKGFEGTIVRRKNKIYLQIAVNFMQQGASVLLQDCQLEYLSPPTSHDETRKPYSGSISVVFNPRSGSHEVVLRSTN